jgi:ABC-type polysaccharide/polyol phosphate export permease
VLCVIFYYLQAPEDWAFQFPAWSVYSLEALSMGINLVSIWVYTRYYGPCLKQEMRLGYATPHQDQVQPPSKNGV